MPAESNQRNLGRVQVTYWVKVVHPGVLMFDDCSSPSHFYIGVPNFPVQLHHSILPVLLNTISALRKFVGVYVALYLGEHP